MAFIRENGTTISFAEYQDVVDKDQRLFESNEGLTDDSIETLLIRATERILTKLRSTSWWREYYIRQSGSNAISSVADIPALDPDKIAARQADFTDLCVYTAMADFILPSIADFGNQDNAERQKMGYYANKSETLFQELVNAGDWYDFDDDSTVESTEKQPGAYNLKRVR
jgi:hypothetical protein